MALPATYKAFTYTQHGPVEDVLSLSQVPLEPLPTSGHVRVRVRSASLNPVDYKLVEWGAAPLGDSPSRIGFDFAGEIVELGADVTGFQLGDHVYGKAPRGGAGSLGEYIAIDALLVARTPSTLDFDHAAGVPGVGLTSYQAVSEHAKLQRGERLLVLGGSSGTGIFAIQYAKSLGATVIATTSTKNLEFVRALGADQVIDYRTQQWGDLLEDHSVDVIYDCGVEPTSWEDSAQRVLKKEDGRFVTLRPGLTPSPAKFGATYQDPMARPSGHDLAEIAKLIDAGVVKVFIDSVYAFEQAKEAFKHLKTGRAVGKVIVQVATQ